MSLLKRTLVFGLLSLATVVACVLFSEPETDPAAGVVVWLPEERLGYQVYSEEMGEAEQEWLPSDTTFLKRTYLESWLSPQQARDNAVSATLIVAGADSRSLHRPSVCLGAQRWTIEARKVVKLETKGGPLEVMDFHLKRAETLSDGSPLLDAKGEAVVSRAHYIYWWIGPDATTPRDEEKVWTEVWSSILKGRRERWAYPSVMVRVTDRGREDAQKRAYKFVTEFAPGFQKSLGAINREGALPLKAME